MLNTIAAWFTLVLYLLYAIKPWRRQLRRLSQRIHDWSMLLVLVPFLLATNLEPELTDLGILALYILIPTLLLRLRPQKYKPFDLFHILTILAIWVPIEPDLFGVGQWVSLPDVTAPLVEGVELPITLLTGLLMALHLFLILHPIKDFTFTFRWKFSDLRDVFSALTVYSLIAIPIGLVMRFLVYQLDIPATVEDGALMLLAGYLLTAVPEEVLSAVLSKTPSPKGLLTNASPGWYPRSSSGWHMSTMPRRASRNPTGAMS